VMYQNEMKKMMMSGSKVENKCIPKRRWQILYVCREEAEWCDGDLC
jgi:hypothetical protein